MATRLIHQAIEDVIPGLSKPYPPQLVSYATTLSLTSNQKSTFLRPEYDIAKYHLSVYCAVLQLRNKLALPEPSTAKVPIPRKQVDSIVRTFMQLIVDPTSNPSTPTKRRISQEMTPSKRRQLATPRASPEAKNTQLATPEATPTKRVTRASLGKVTTRVTQKLIDIADEEDDEEDVEKISDDDFELVESEEEEEEIQVDAREAAELSDDEEYAEPGVQLFTPRSTPRRKRTLEPETPRKRGRPRKNIEEAASLKGNAALIDVRIESTKKPMSRSDLEAFCRRLDIPVKTIASIILSFNEFRNRIKNEWALLCGLVAVAYTRLYSEKLESKIGAKSDFYNNLHSFQNGGLRKQDMAYWVGVVERLVSYQQWVRDLETKGNPTEVWGELPTVGDMINSSVRYSSAEYSARFESWKAAFAKELDASI